MFKRKGRHASRGVGPVLAVLCAVEAAVRALAANGLDAAARGAARGTGRIVTAVASWWAYVLRYEVRELWQALPGPWWCKALLIVVCLAIPGPADEVARCRRVAAETAGS